jgi:hypothetical protein
LLLFANLFDNDNDNDDDDNDDDSTTISSCSSLESHHAEESIQLIVSSNDDEPLQFMASPRKSIALLYIVDNSGIDLSSTMINWIGYYISCYCL